MVVVFFRGGASSFLSDLVAGYHPRSRGRRCLAAAGIELREDVIRANGRMALPDQFPYLATDIRQTSFALSTNGRGLAQGVSRATGMVMAGFGKGWFLSQGLAIL